MDIIEDFDITIDSSFLATYRSLPMEMYKVFREFIDNSLQSYLDHKEELNKLPGSNKLCIVDIKWNADEIIIRDNAWGMNKEAFGRALKANVKAPEADNPNRLSRFGLGLKTASCYASRDYIIDSCEYNSGIHYHTEMDVDFIEKNSPKTNKTVISVTDKTKHGTVIHLKNLNDRCKFSDSSFKRVNKYLGKIYDQYITEQDLQITINNLKVISPDPELYKDDEDIWNGSEILTTFDNHEGFAFQGKRYRYSGWIGMLDTGDTSGNDTGFSYYQAKRAITLSDHPEELFGKKTDFRFQRVVGQIYLEGNEWSITINKDMILWGEQGLRECFLKDLKLQPRVKEIFDIAKNLRKRKKPVDTNNIVHFLGQDKKPSDLSKSVESSRKTPKSTANDIINHSVASTVIEKKHDDIHENGNKLQSNYISANNVNSNPVIKEKTIGEIESEKDKGTEAFLSVGDKEYQFELFVKQNDPIANWVSLSKSNNDKNKWKIEINMASPFLKPYIGDRKSQALIIAFAEAFCIARIQASENGLQWNQSQALEYALNEVMRKSK